MNHPKQHTLWLLAALAAPIAHLSGTGWLTAALTALAILPLSLIPRSWEDIPKPLAYLEAIWLGVVAGLLLPASAANWPSDNTRVVPLTILALAIFTNTAAAPRIGSVLAFCMALLAIPVGIAAAQRIEPEWLAPTLSPWSPGLILILLLPALPAAGDRKRRIPYAALLTIVITTLTQGVLSPQVTAAVPDPFYQTARTLGHLEPVTAAGLTLGWYALTCFLLQNGARIAKSSGIKPKTATTLAAAAAAITILIPWQPNKVLITAITALLWLIVPLTRKITARSERQN